jgi:hypothetical protein
VVAFLCALAIPARRKPAGDVVPLPASAPVGERERQAVAG